MDMILDIFGAADDSNMMLASLLIFLAVAIPAFAIMLSVHSRGVVKRRAAGISVGYGETPDNNGMLRQSGLKAGMKLMEYTTKHYASLDDESMKVLRRRLVQAGIFDPKGVAYFFLIRTGLAIGLAIAVFMSLPLLTESAGMSFWLFVGSAGLFGYLAPSLYVDRMIKVRGHEYRAGFPDFMDLLVVCADAGLSMEASLERVGREISDSYPYLSANIHMTNLEIRAGRKLAEALEHFGDRLRLEEVRAFATLIQQSEELGSSITDALRVYSDDMRHKRLSRAEEKAYSLPAKLALPMMLCIFPVLFVVILLPVFVRIKMGAY